jgi:hypothetical protein
MTSTINGVINKLAIFLVHHVFTIIPLGLKQIIQVTSDITSLSYMFRDRNFCIV